MTVWKIIIKEIAHRKGHFLMSVLAVAVAVAFLSGALTLLKADSLITTWLLDQKETEIEKNIAQKEEAVKQAGIRLQDTVRKITKGLGFNILILPENQDLNELHVTGKISQTFPEDYVKRLAEAKMVTINHLLPMVSETIQWDEKNMTVILTGTRGEIPFTHRIAKKPLQEQVPAGTMVIGFQIQQKLKLSVGEKVTLKGKEFKVTEIYPERGTADDSTVWINLKEAQEILGRQNLLNAILALECNCATIDRVAEIRHEIASILPGTKVIERGPPALARAEARNKAKQSAQEALLQEQAASKLLLDRERENRKKLTEQRTFFATTLGIFILVCATFGLGALTCGNVRQRRGEIAILRAFGVRASQILTIITGRNIVIGFLGAFAGVLAGCFAGGWFGIQSALKASLAFEANLNLSFNDLWEPGSLWLVFFLAPVLALVAGWFPALLASQTDPATILQSEG